MRIAPFARYALVLALMGFAMQINAYAKQKWLRATTDDVVIISDASPKVVTEYAVRYSAFRHVFIQLLTPAGRSPPPVVLLLFRNKSELIDHLAKSDDAKGSPLAFSTEVDNAALLALADSGDRETGLSLAFEFDTIWSLRRVGHFLPLWMTQGTGQVMASLQIRKNDCLINGDLDRVSGIWREHRALPWQRFFDIYQESPEYKGKEATGIYQAQAWALMNLILLQEGNTRERFGTLAKMIQNRQGEQQSVENILGIPPTKFETAIGKQLRGNHSITIPFDGKAILARLKIESADEAEVNVRRADLLIANGRENEGVALTEQAAILAPQSIYVNEALARRELRRNDTAAAARYYRVALAAGSANTNALLISATDRLEQTMSYGGDTAGGGGKSTILALEEIHRALQLDPGDLNAWRLLGRAYFVAEQASEVGVVELSRVLTDEVNAVHVRYYRGLLYFRLGKKSEAIADLDHVIANSRSTQGLRTSAASFKMQIQFADDNARVDQLLREENYAAARLLVDRGLELATGTPSVKRYQHLRSWVDENECSTKIVACYDQKDWAGVVEAAKAFLEEFPRSAFRNEARKLAASAEDFQK